MDEEPVEVVVEEEDEVLEAEVVREGVEVLEGRILKVSHVVEMPREVGEGEELDKAAIVMGRLINLKGNF